MSSSPPTATPLGRVHSTPALHDRPLLLSIEVLLVLAGFALLWPTTHGLIVEWEDTDKTTYTHGYLIVLVTFWLLWRNRDRLQSTSAVPLVRAAALLAAASVLWLISVRAGIRLGGQLLLPAMMWLSVWTALGRRAALQAAFALGYLYFSIPIWNSINGALQAGTVVAVDLMLRVTGILAYVQGNMVHLAAGVFEIAGGCSGLHFFIVALALALLHGEVHRDTLATRLKLLALAVVLALVTNWVRVYTIIVAGYLTDMQHYLVRVEHYKFGWCIFSVSMILFFVIARRFPVADEPPLPPAEASAPVSTRTSMLALLCALSAFAIGPLWNLLVPVSAASLPPQFALLPADPVEWTGPLAGNSLAWQPTFSDADVRESGEYRHDGRAVQAFAATYAWQAQGRELIGYQHDLVEKTSQIVARSAVDSLPWNELTIKDADDNESLLWYSYLIDSRQTRSELVAQLGYGLASLLQSPRSSVLAVRSACRPDCAAARAAVRGFVSSSGWSTVANNPGINQ